MAPSILIIGAGGNFGSAVMNEFIAQKSTFGRVDILTDFARKDKFAQYMTLSSFLARISIRPCTKVGG